MEANNQNIFIKGEHVALKVLDEDDVYHSNWYAWFNNENTTQFMMKHYYPNTRSEQLEYWKNAIKGSRDRIQLGIMDAQGGPLLGCVSLSLIDPIHRKAEIATIIGEESARGVKYFFESNKLMLQHGFYELNLYRIFGGTLVKEYADLMCRFFGFQIEGIARSDVYKHGKYHDVYMLGLIEPDFKYKKS
jgi:RimJ/RimL family protein N-acetyltransferase